MTERLAHLTDEDLGRALRDLGPRLAVPPAPRLASAVRGRIEAGAGERPSILVLRPRLRRALVLAAILVPILAAAAVGARFALRGVEIRRVPQGTPLPSPAPSADLGDRVSLAEARRMVQFPVRVPRDLGPPDLVFVDTYPPVGGRVTLVYHPRPGLPPTAHREVGLMLTQFPGRENGELLVKAVRADETRVQRVSVGDAVGFWVSGAPHEVLFEDRDGTIFPDTVRIAGDVLVWQRGGVVLRIESALSRDQAIRIGASAG